jgi:hypothetical protein
VSTPSACPHSPRVVWLLWSLVQLSAAGCSFDTSPLVGPNDPPQQAPNLISPVRTYPNARADAGLRLRSPEPRPNEVEDAATAPSAQPPAPPNAPVNATVPSPSLSPPPPTAAAPLDAAVERDAGVVPPPTSLDAAPPADAAAPIAIPNPCHIGLYTSTLTCTVEGLGSVVTASISFDLELASPMAAIATTKADFSFMSSGASFDASLTAQLDCATGTFHADIVNASSPADALVVIAPFTGVIDGRVDASMATLAGAWSLSSVAGISSCTGTWSVALPH